MQVMKIWGIPEDLEPYYLLRLKTAIQKITGDIIILFPRDFLGEEIVIETTLIETAEVENLLTCAFPSTKVYVSS